MTVYVLIEWTLDDPGGAVTITCISVTATRAVLELQPCWLARWFRARTRRVALARDEYGRWVLEHTQIHPPNRWVESLAYQTVDALPEARTVQR